jgi:hypothetical protein
MHWPSAAEEIPLGGGAAMTHFESMPESAGDFTAERLAIRPCKKCGKMTDHKCQTWESHCGSYVDYKFTCLGCRTVYWVDGIDS